MDNALAVPGYKRYRDPAGGGTPACLVTFLDLVRATPDVEVNGVLLPVDADGLAALDAREHNYVRVELTEHVRPAPAGRVVAYVGSAAGRARAARGRATGTGVVHAGYRTLCEQAFQAHGPDELTRYHASTADPDLPVHDLERIALPPVVASGAAVVGHRARGPGRDLPIHDPEGPASARAQG